MWCRHRSFSCANAELQLFPGKPHLNRCTMHACHAFVSPLSGQIFLSSQIVVCLWRGTSSTVPAHLIYRREGYRIARYLMRTFSAHQTHQYTSCLCVRLLPTQTVRLAFAQFSHLHASYSGFATGRPLIWNLSLSIYAWAKSFTDCKC